MPVHHGRGRLRRVRTAFGEYTPPADGIAPTITSSASVSVAENATLAHALTADEAVTWTITGGADELQFDITGSTLTWVGDGTQDFEAPADADTNNAYVVQVTATDAALNATNQTITVTVTDVDEGGGGGDTASLYWFLPVFGRAA